MTDARAAVLALLGVRDPDATVCPSEVARSMGGADWRDEMAAVHAAVDGLVAEGRVRLSWRGAVMDMRDGPYQIGRAKA